jgi:hypothetical protein
MWKTAGKIFLWQLLAAVAVMLVGLVAVMVLDKDAPSSLTGLAVLLGTQTYVLQRERKEPGAIRGKVWALTWRATLISILFETVFGYLYLSLTAADVPEYAQLLEALREPQFAALIWLAVAVLTLGCTALGIGAGLRVARKVAEKRAPTQAGA